jgi:hypothetical protein
LSIVDRGVRQPGSEKAMTRATYSCLFSILDHYHVSQSN